jgi:hypothetical protein
MVGFSPEKFGGSRHSRCRNPVIVADSPMAATTQMEFHLRRKTTGAVILGESAAPVVFWAEREIV